MTDIPARLADMDRLGIHYQVVMPTLFLLPVTEEDLPLERALCQSYNRFLGHACDQSGGRIRYAAVVPWRDMADAVAVTREAKDLGAVAVMLPGLMGDHALSESCFLPLYEEIARLDLALAIHVAWGSPGLTGVFRDGLNSGFSALVLPNVMGFWSLAVGGVYERFPDLRVGFFEAGAEWVPYLITQLERRYERGQLTRHPREYLDRGNIFIACETNEDVPYLVRRIGADNLVIGSDYGHGDASVEDNLIDQFDERQGDLSPQVREKILSANALRLYHLPG
jgi:predicted TIM-barrel fold metal-dependent hydrolase